MIEHMPRDRQKRRGDLFDWILPVVAIVWFVLEVA